MIKKTLLLIGLFVLGTINFINAGYTRQYGTYGYNPYKSTIDIKINTDGTFYTDISDVEKKIFLFDGDSYSFWNSDGLIYYVYNANGQGILSHYKLCDTLNGNETNKPGNCTEDIDVLTDGTTKNFFGNFLKTITNNDYYYFSMARSGGAYDYDLCLSSNAYGKSLCFYFTSGEYYRIENSSINMPYKNYGNISDSLLYNAPVGNSEGNQIQTIRTGHNYYCPTFKQLLSTYPSNYSTGLCYNGTLKYENGQLTTVQKQDIFTVFTDYEEYQNYVYLYNNYCTGPATQTACENAFNGEREKYSIISNAYNKNVDDKKMWQYCDIALNYDLNTTTCTAGTGTLDEIGVAPTPENITDLIEQLNNIGDVQIPITGNILNQLLDEGETREDISAWNILGNLDQIKEKLSNIFEERTGTTGIIPDYIMWLIMVSLLLTVLLKK